MNQSTLIFSKVYVPCMCSCLYATPLSHAHTHPIKDKRHYYNNIPGHTQHRGTTLLSKISHHKVIKGTNFYVQTFIPGLSRHLALREHSNALTSLPTTYSTNTPQYTDSFLRAFVHTLHPILFADTLAP